MLSPQARRSRARLAGLTRASRYDGVAITARATAAAEARFLKQVTTEAAARGEKCTPEELARRARLAKAAFYESITFASLVARGKRKKAAGKKAAA